MDDNNPPVDQVQQDSDLINSYYSTPQQRAIASIDTDPDRAAAAVSLGKATGVDPSIISGDLDGFRDRMKSSMAGQIIGSDPTLQNYVRNNPMAASVSNDDWGALGILSKVGNGLHQAEQFMQAHDPITRGGQAAIAGIGEGFGSEPLGSWEGDSVKNWNPVSRFLLTAEGALPEIAARGINAIFSGGAAGIGEAIDTTRQDLGGKPEPGRTVGQEISDLIQYHFISGGDPAVGGAIENALEAAKAANPWAREGLEVPTGVHPQIDAAKTQINSFGVQQLDNSLAAAMETATRERSPEMTENFLREKFGSGSFGISGDLVAKLYGDKVPGPDDGLLGFVPDMAQQLEIAKQTGGDVHVPIAAWLAKVDPEVATALHDGIRFYPGGVTALEAAQPPEPGITTEPPVPNESAAAPEETGEAAATTDTMQIPQPKSVVDSPLALIRGVDGLEPLFSIGDRKLQLAREADRGVQDYARNQGLDWNSLSDDEKSEVLDAATKDTDANPFHNYKFIDEHGNTVGELEIVPDPVKKQLYVANVSGVAGQYSNSFGPSLIRDLKRQLRQMYPGYETITGHRVSGARYEAGTWETDIAHPTVKLDEASDGWADALTVDRFRQIMEGTFRQQVSQDITSDSVPTELLQGKLADVSTAIEEEIRRMVGPGVEVEPSSKLIVQSTGAQPHGVFFPTASRVDGARLPKIIYNLFHPDAMKTALHESIHALRRMGFFTQQEWGTLAKAAHDGNWISRYRVDERYPGAPEWLKLEEAVAEHFPHWVQEQADHIGRTFGSIPVGKIFGKLQDLWSRIQGRMGEIFGHAPSYDELFRRAHAGELVQHPNEAAKYGEEYQPRPMMSVDSSHIDEQMNNIRAEAMGLDSKSYENLMKLNRERFAGDIEAANKRTERYQRRAQTQEWKNNRAEVETEVTKQIRTRPDVAADLLLSTGELYGEKIAGRYTLAKDELTPEQQEALPAHYQSKNGLSPDGIAATFGYKSGDEMVNRLIEYQATKAGRSPNDAIADQVKTQTDAVMAARYGDLNQNVMSEAQDHAYSDENVNLIGEDMQAAGLLSKTVPIDKVAAAARADEIFGQLQLGSIKLQQMIAAVGRHSRNVERSLLGGDPATAMVSLQNKYLASLVVNRTLKLEKDIKAFNRTASIYGKNPKELSVAADYKNWIDDTLSRVGKTVARAPWDVKKDIAAGASKTITDFAEEKAKDMRSVAVAEFLGDASWRKSMNEMTVDEFRAVKGTIDSLVHNGREEMKIYRAGEAKNLAEIKQQIMDQLPEKDILYTQPDGKGPRKMGAIPGPIADLLRHGFASVIQMENLLFRFDHFDHNGPWSQYVMRGLVEGSTREDARVKEFTKKITDTDDGINWKKPIENSIFKNPYGQTIPMTRGGLRAVILNLGNSAGKKSNAVKLADGYGLTVPVVKAWAESVSTKADWDWAQKIWDIFADIKDRSDTMYRSESGVAPGSVRIDPIETRHGTYRGGYYPLIYDDEFEGTSQKQIGGDVLENFGYNSAEVPANYTKERTTYSGPLALHIDAMPMRIKQMLHDIEMRPAVVNASKIFMDHDVRNAIALKYGSQFRDQFFDYLRSVANSANYNSKADTAFGKLSDFARVNMVSTLIGANPITIGKHGLTTAVTSIRQVGLKNYIAATGSLLTHDLDTTENNWNFAVGNSYELQRRHLNMSENLFGSVNQLQGRGAWSTVRQWIIQHAGDGVALSDMLSSVPTWLAQYKTSTEAGLAHGDAVFEADRAVRWSHGSTSPTNRTMAQRNLSPWLTSFYNLFSDMFNRQTQTVWEAGEALGLAKAGNKAKAMGMIPGIAASVFAFSLAPAMIENLLSPPNMTAKQKRDEGYLGSLGRSAISFGASGMPLVRDFVSAVANGDDPSLGLGGTAMRTLYNAAADAFRHNNDAKVQHQQKMLEHGTMLFGLLTGAFPAPIGRQLAFDWGVAKGTEHPKSPWDWMTGSRFGTLKGH